MTVEQILERENWQLVQFEKLGFTLYEAIDAIQNDVDYHDVEWFVKQHPDCSPQMAARIV